MQPDELDYERMAEFLQELKIADAVMVDGGPVLTSWITEAPDDVRKLEPQDALVWFSWTNEEGFEYDVMIGADAFKPVSKPERHEDGRWKLADFENEPTEISLFKLIPLRRSPESVNVLENT